MNPDGSDQRNLTNNPAVDVPTGWSPDGSEILFLSNRSGNQEIYVMNADGSDVRQLTDNPAADTFGIWRPCPGTQPIPPVVTPAPLTCTLNVPDGANQRSGPSTSFPIRNVLTAGAITQAQGQAIGSDSYVWWQLTDGTWVRSDVVDEAPGCDALPTVPTP
jgi:hypothetical protein